MPDFLGTTAGILQVVIGFGALIFVHELGHFLVAKYFGVRVNEFSLGFGAYLFSWQRGDTRYAIRVIPLGGFVEMRGQNDLDAGAGQDMAPDSYAAKSVPQRMGIIVAGVTMNAIFAVILLVAAFMLGVQYVPPVVEQPSATSNAAQARCVSNPDLPRGLQEGDRILSVNGWGVSRYFDAQTIVALSGENETEVLVERAGKELRFIVPTPEEPLPGSGGVMLHSLGVQPDMIQKQLPVGMSAKPTVALTALPEEQAKESPAVAAGIKPGDLLLSVNGQKPENLPEVAQEAGAAGEPLSLVVLREQDGKPSERLTIQVTPELAAGPAFLAGIGRGTQNRPDGPEDATAPPRTYMIGVQMAQGPHLVTNVEPGGPAAEAGIEEGDLLGILYPPAVTDLDELDEVVMHPWRNGKPDLANPLHVAVDRNSELAIHFEQSVTQLAKAGLVGAVPMAVEETTRLLGTTYWTLYALITNKVSFKAMSGPVGIMQTMYKSSGPGFGFYLWFLALISINLAVINLLPIPVLDGGHLMFLAIEGIRRKPLSQRVQEMALWSGIALLLTMILIVTWNDVMRLFI